MGQTEHLFRISAKYVGQPRKFATAEDLRVAIVAYFEWSIANPLVDIKTGVATKTMVFSQEALTLHIGVAVSTWYSWADRNHEGFKPDYLEVITWALNAIRQQKFSLAAADMLNANIIARDLGLIDRQVIETIEAGQMRDITPGASAVEAEEAYTALLQGGV